MSKRTIVGVGVAVIGLAFAARAAATGEPDKDKPAKVEWGKEVNGLVVAISPAKEGRFVIRWRNAGKETLELQWVRFGSDAAYKHLDDLLDHVFFKNADGKL